MLYDDNFDGVLSDADNIYQNKKREYGESWKDMSEEQLTRRLETEIQELREAKGLRSKYKECLDVINVTLMLAKRLLEINWNKQPPNRIKE